MSRKALGKSSVAVAALLLAFGLVRVSGAAELPPAAVVLQAEGRWIMEGDQSGPLQKGRTLPAGARIVAAGPDHGNLMLVVSDLEGRIIHSVTCSGAAECGGAWSVPVAGDEGPSLTKRFVASMATLWRSKPASYESLISRGGGGFPATRVLVEAENGMVKTDILLAGLPPGSYELVREQEVTSSFVANVTWDGADGGAGLEIAKGFYTLRERDGGTPTWVLVVPVEGASLVRSCLTDAESVVNQWSGSVGPGVIYGARKAAVEFCGQESGILPR